MANAHPAFTGAAKHSVDVKVGTTGGGGPVDVASFQHDKIVLEKKTLVSNAVRSGDGDRKIGRFAAGQYTEWAAGAAEEISLGSTIGIGAWMMSISDGGGGGGLYWVGYRTAGASFIAGQTADYSTASQMSDCTWNTFCIYKSTNSHSVYLLNNHHYAANLAIAIFAAAA